MTAHPARRRVLLGGLALASAALQPSFPTAQGLGISGQYQVDGRNPDGSPYSGVVRIVDNGGSVAMTWDIQGQTTQGRGRVEGRVLTVDWGSDDPVIYVIMPDGALYGTWARGQALDLLTPIP